jgi:hypothetical protein
MSNDRAGGGLPMGDGGWEGEEERRREETGNGPSSVVNHMIKVRGGRGEETLCVKLGIGNEERRGEERRPYALS